MESSAPPLAFTHELQPELAALFGSYPRYLSLYLDVRGDVENASAQLALRWRNIRRALADDGVNEPVLAAVDPLIAGDHGEGETLGVIATVDGVLFHTHMPEPPRRDLVRWSTLPAIGPVLEARQSSPAHLVVQIDRTGADLVAFRRDGDDVLRTIEGSDAHSATKSAPGGWSQRRFQQRVENTWEANAGEVADAVVDLVDAIDARLVLVAGDVRAVGLLQKALPPRVAALMQVVSGGRSPDGSTDDVADHVARLVATAVAEDTRTILQKFTEEWGQRDRAADGPELTIEAFRRGQVATLLLQDDPDDERTAWFGEEAVHVALDEVTLRTMGAQEAREGRLADVLLRAAAGTSAEVWLVPAASAPTAGVGALLRWADQEAADGPTAQ
jgi:hypothetical protein